MHFEVVVIQRLHDLEHPGEDLHFWRPLTQARLEWLSFFVSLRFGQLFVVGKRFDVERMPGQVINEIQKQTPFPGPPQLTKINSTKCKVNFDRPAVPR